MLEHSHLLSSPSVGTSSQTRSDAAKINVIDKEFSWDDSEAIIVKRTEAIAVYTNPNGNIVIRQEGIGYGDDPGDQVVVIPRERVSDVIEALSKELVAAT